MAVFAEANNRLFTNMYVCLVCKSKQRSRPLKVQAGAVRCRSCGSHSLRPVRRK